MIRTGRTIPRSTSILHRIMTRVRNVIPSLSSKAEESTTPSARVLSTRPTPFMIDYTSPGKTVETLINDPATIRTSNTGKPFCTRIVWIWDIDGRDFLMSAWKTVQSSIQGFFSRRR